MTQNDASTTAPRRRGGGAVRWVIIVIIAVFACTLAALGPDASTWWNLQRWSTVGPKGAVDELRTAIDAGDATALQGIMLSPDQVIQGSDGTLSIRSSTRAAASNMPVERLRLAPTPADVDIQYVTVSKPPEVRMDIPLADEDGDVTVIMVRDGGWRISQLRVRGGVMRELKGPLSPGAKDKSGPKDERAAGGGSDEDDPTDTDQATDPVEPAVSE